MLSVIVRQAGNAVALRAAATAPALRSAFATFDSTPMGGLKGYSEKERAVENAYFSKEDERLLRKLLNKVKTVSDIDDVHAAAGIDAQERSSLNAIVGKYNMSKEDFDALIAWRHHHAH
mmetsp:Transcript_22925/g.63629  ORF Transcript_22925/g.63629 Transcript_22925/m.63629 type:complete len:119 (+) Transcript_22925:96-452(+)|eukprot:CAMPEP_0117667952 /NCGR_PEP_ID=MMETSP0804-20121206/11259_1 /TAXON_ID=1074897 /ORGANISM="Tetraselmis astigmatica, Strain CCMP880" /LENGTH=118 /DNA_ID=CAMNT_0005475749 /DNA_START=79 /DNA_END=435 /DNA_ORIENTATION=-